MRNNICIEVRGYISRFVHPYTHILDCNLVSLRVDILY